MKITVYCGASNGNAEIHQQATKRLGKWIAEKQHTLVYGGGKAGLMGLIADTVLSFGGDVIGVMPTFLQQRELAHSSLTEMITVHSMPERKLKMIELGDAYIALPGGPGTLEEISEVVSWARIGQNSNPCIFFNSGNYYGSLKQFYDEMVTAGFLTQADRNKILFSESLEEIEHFITNYTPPDVRKY